MTTIVRDALADAAFERRVSGTNGWSVPPLASAMRAA